MVGEDARDHGVELREPDRPAAGGVLNGKIEAAVAREQRTDPRAAHRGHPLHTSPPYLYLASLLAIIVRDDGPGWLHIPVRISIWSALRMLWIGPISLILSARVCLQEHAQRRADHRQTKTNQGQVIGQAPVLAGGTRGTDG